MELTGKQRRHLRALAHHLAVVAHVGDAGLSDPVVAHVDAQLEHHELIKVKFTQNSPVKAKEAAQQLASATRSHVAQVIGHTVVLYRRHAKEPVIELPKGD